MADLIEIKEPTYEEPVISDMLHIFMLKEELSGNRDKVKSTENLLSLSEKKIRYSYEESTKKLIQFKKVANLDLNLYKFQTKNSGSYHSENILPDFSFLSDPNPFHVFSSDGSSKIAKRDLINTKCVSLKEFDIDSKIVESIKEKQNRLKKIV